MPNLKKSLQDVFAKAVGKAGRSGRAKKNSEHRFSAQEVADILKLMEDLQLPIPQNTDEFMAGRSGCLLFINRYGVVVRIEAKSPETDINDSPWVLQPLARFQRGTAVLEICPACGFENDKKRYNALKKNLEKDGLKLWDTGMRQLGRIPVKTPEFPEGVTVVVDRDAVCRLSEDVKPVQNALQEKFYGPLRQKMSTAQNGGAFDAQKVKEFWTLCEQFVDGGKLVAGWNDYQPLYDNKWEGKNAKGLQAQDKAKAYGRRF